MSKMIVGGRQAKVGEGEWRVGVFIDNWEQVKNTLENLSPKSMGGIDPAVWFYSRWFYSRWFVLLPLFDEFKEGLEKHG